MLVILIFLNLKFNDFVWVISLIKFYDIVCVGSPINTIQKFHIYFITNCVIELMNINYMKNVKSIMASFHIFPA